MTFNLQRPVPGYRNIVNESGKVLGQIPGLENTMQTRMAAIGLEEDAKNQILENQIKMMELGVPSQQSQGFGLSQGLDLATNLFGAFSGGFGGGDAANYSPTGAPGFGAENVDWQGWSGFTGIRG